MSFLRHASAVIHEWGFHENALFTCIEADEFLRELYLYMLLHKRQQWHAFPMYAANHDSRTNELLAVVHHCDDIFPLWRMKTLHENNHDGTSHYYISIDTLITRCTCWKECIEKIDSIAENIDAIMDSIKHHIRCLALIRYLSHECERSSDPVHSRAMQNKITVLRRDLKNKPYHGPRVSEESATRDDAQTHRAEP